MAQAVKCEISFEELEKYRNTEGFIDLDKLGLELTDESREKVGNEKRIKNWIDFSGTEALIKSECRLDGKKNGRIYAELIVEELAKQIGFETAYYDLIKINGEYGVLSKKILRNTQTDLLSLDSLIGNTEFYEDYPEISDYIEVEEKLYQAIKDEELEKESRKEIINDFRKQTAFYIMICALDKHTENISFISYINSKTRKKEVHLSPIYDNEDSLMLDTDLETLEKISKHGLGLQRNVDMLEPKVAVLNGEYESLWKSTLYVLCEEDDIYDFVVNGYEKLDIKQAIGNVENKIKAPIPEIVKTTATYVFKFRKKEVEKVLYPELESNSLGSIYSNQIASKSVQEGIRQGEEDDILRKIMNIYGIDEKSYEM